MSNATVYIPSADEPSIFGTNLGQPSTEWIMWRSYKANKSILAAFEDGLKVIEQLVNEEPRNVGPIGPEMIIESEQFKKAGIRRRQLSLAWVIHTKYVLGADWMSTYKVGFNMLTDESLNG